MRKLLLVPVLLWSIGCNSSSTSSKDAGLAGLDGKMGPDLPSLEAGSTAAPTLPFDIVIVPAPNPPIIGGNTPTITITGANAVPVQGATVKVSYLMTTMPGMGGVAAVSENGGGVYVAANVNFTMEGPWKVSVVVNVAGLSATQDVIFTLER